MKVVSIVGARPQFIKCAPVSRVLRKEAIEILIHTGQHYDHQMSEVFFRELAIPEPDYNLGVGSGPHGAQTGEMLKRVEEVLLKEKPDVVLVYGDTNSTLAGGVAAAKLRVPVAHVEAGLRSFNPAMPEEINRKLVDHLSTFLFAPTETAVKNLLREGFTAGIALVGDVMYDSALQNLEMARVRSRVIERLGIQRKLYALATVHRAGNTDEPERLRSIFEALQALSREYPVVFPAHPRTRKALRDLGCVAPSGLIMPEPVSYLDMLLLESEARVILTDSGGVQKEALFFHVPCVTLREETEWTETVESGWNVLAGTDTRRIINAVHGAKAGSHAGSPFGQGDAAERVVSALVKEFSRRESLGKLVQSGGL